MKQKRVGKKNKNTIVFVLFSMCSLVLNGCQKEVSPFVPSHAYTYDASQEGIVDPTELSDDQDEDRMGISISENTDGDDEGNNSNGTINVLSDMNGAGSVNDNWVMTEDEMMEFLETELPDIHIADMPEKSIISQESEEIIEDEQAESEVDDTQPNVVEPTTETENTESTEPITSEENTEANTEETTTESTDNSEESSDGENIDTSTDDTTESADNTETDSNEDTTSGEDSNASTSENTGGGASESEKTDTEEPTTEETDVNAIVDMRIEGELGAYIWGETPRISDFQVYIERASGEEEEIVDYTIDMNYPELQIEKADLSDETKTITLTPYTPGIYNATISYEGNYIEVPYELHIYYVLIEYTHIKLCTHPKEHGAYKLTDAIEMFGLSNTDEVYTCSNWRYYETMDTGYYGWGGIAKIPLLYDYQLTEEEFSNFCVSDEWTVSTGFTVEASGVGSKVNEYTYYLYSRASVHYHDYEP
ncbi:MAG: hypothetical protein IJ040_05735 [Lachnospiraceae bacterium]|nr:hypothetical protein [Lachnospiraceae bacterium]